MQEHTPSCIHSFRNHIRRPGDLIVADLVGPLPISYDNMKYVLVIQDFSSRLTTTIPLRDKTEAKNQFIDWMKQFMTTTSFKIKSIPTDNGSEFKNSTILTFTTQHGIAHELSIPYEHHQNGLIECTNRTIIEIEQTSLISAGIPVQFWPYSFKHAAFIFNRVLHADLDKMPYKIFSGLKPTLSLLKVFGAKAYLFNHLHRKDLGPRGILGYHMGISPDSKGLIFWIPKKGNFFMKSASVKFDENNFYHIPKDQILSSIQVLDLMDNSMVKEIELQDSLICSLNTQSNLCDVILTSLKEVSLLPDKELWEEAMNDEITSMEEEKVFELTDLSTVLKTQKISDILSSKWVFAKKTAPLCYKARLVARGFQQTRGINFEETFAPTLTFGALWLLLSIAISNNWTIKTFDVKVAFLHSIINMPVFIWPPQGMAVGRDQDNRQCATPRSTNAQPPLFENQPNNDQHAQITAHD
ncbi:hypothetical protein O181_031509 [Austropuccinia psidii MF-1]|uniref:Integrase catalytic domain-containing protein n=1 Tax=Austropuccinia psidii MF-1 TaxID=1389203 RepID=A0A9Q3CVV5_9BASI|nr:hypothetical protein [Austropuccinia psidii MF-1]